MTQQIIDVGANANDGTGEPLREAFTAVNDNFTQIWTAGPVGSQVQISGNIVTTTVTNLGLTLAGNGIGNIQANSTVVPGTSGVYDLGAPDRTFQYIYGDYLVGNGALITGIVANTSYNNSNVAAFLPTYTGNLVSLTGPVRTTANVIAGNLITSGFLGVTGNITGGNITGNNLISAGYVSAVGKITTVGNIAGNYLLGNGAFITGITATNIAAGALTGTVLSSNVLYSSLKVVDDLLYLDVVGNVTTQGRFSGSGAGLTNIPGANVTGSVANAVYANTAGTVINPAQPNITSVGTLSALSVNGNIRTTGLISATGNIKTVGNITGNYYIGNGALLTGITVSGGTAIINGNSNVVVGGNGNVTVGVTGISNVAVFTPAGIEVTGEVSATGNVYGNIILSDNYFYANGVPVPFGIGYTAAINPPGSPNVADQWYDTASDVLYEYINDGTTSYWVDTTSPAFAGGVVANVAISGTLVPVANVTYDIGTSGVYFRNTYTQNLYTNNRLVANNMPVGAVVQTVMSSSLGGSITNSTNYVDINYANVTIVPSSATNRVLIIATGTSSFTALSGANVTADTQLARSPSTSLQVQTFGTAVLGGGLGVTGAVSYSYIDSPGTTSPVTYKLQQKVSNSSSTLTSTNIWLIAMEIAAS